MKVSTDTLRERGDDIQYVDPTSAIRLWDAADEIDHLRSRNERLEDALMIVLPMAKGYAHEHPVGANQEKCDHAERLLSAEPEKG